MKISPLLKSKLFVSTEYSKELIFIEEHICNIYFTHWLKFTQKKES